MGLWYSIPLVVAGLASMAASAVALAFIGLPYTPLSQVLDQENPYGDPQLLVSGQIILQGGDQQNLQDSSVVISRPGDSDPIPVDISSDGTFEHSLEPGDYSLTASHSGWASRTRGFALTDADLNLGPIQLLLPADGECPGGMPGEDGSLRVLGVSNELSASNSLIQNFQVQLSEPGEVWVEYHRRDNAGWVLSSGPTPTLDTEHQFPVMRLRPETVYCYQVYAGANPGSGPVSDSFPGQFTAGPLPENLADSKLNQYGGTQTYDLTLLEFNTDDFFGLVALDVDAEIVWYYEHNSPVSPVAQKENLNLVFVEGSGQNAVEIKPDGSEVDRVTDVQDDGTPCAPDGRWHHESLIQPNGKILFLGSEIRDVSIDGAVQQQTGDTIMEWDQNQGTVSTLVSLFDLLDPVVDRTSASDITGGFFWRSCDGQAPSHDWTHSNSIWLAEDGSYIISVRHLNQIIAIEPDLQAVRWRLGGPNSDFTFPNANDQFYHQYSAKLLPNGNVLLFDNGNVRPEAEGGQYSRALELELDLVNMEARKVWEYRFSPDLYAGCCSNVHRLDNGNTVLVFGSDTNREICCRVFTLVEADANGSTVSAIEITSPGKDVQYRAYPLDSINGESRVVTQEECPGALPGEVGTPRVLGVSTGLSPTNSLIQNFDVQLNEPGVVWVEYHPRDDAEKVLNSGPTPNLDTEHQFPLMRLTADTGYCYQVYASANSDSGPVSDSFPGEFTTGPLPAGLVSSSFTQIAGRQTYDLTLLDFNASASDFTGMVALDEDAQLVWYYEHDSSVSPISQKENFNLVFVEGSHQHAVEIKPDGSEVDRITDLLEDGTPCAPDGRWHHEVLARPDDKVLFLGSEIRNVNIDGADRNLTADVIMEWDQSQGTVTPLVSLFDVLDPATDRSILPRGPFWQGCDGEIPSEDWTHSNSIWVAEDGSYIISVRHLNQIIAIEPDLQSLRWQLGGANSDFTFPNANDQFYHQHSAKLLPNGNVLLFDNGNGRPEEEGGEYSRALELELDQDSMEARKVWEYRSTPDLYSVCCSSAERLDNGNTVLVFGNDPRANSLVEADANGSTVSAIEISSPGRTTQYRAYALDSINGESRR